MKEQQVFTANHSYIYFFQLEYDRKRAVEVVGICNIEPSKFMPELQYIYDREG